MNKPCPCLGDCPDNCNSCIYSDCKKPVDFALVRFRLHRMISFICTERENYEERLFYSWYKQYFNIQ